MLRSLETLVEVALPFCHAVVVGDDVGSDGENDDSSVARWIAMSVPTCAL